ncbi:MAG TPA: hypothetical protein VFG42_00385 [Baekduia sp.]|uniref:hypothetical protein n=1 Tax=Baekduia sp. TaxID=2600305 RepID=UPI002D793245|nr:hypothetical protein [Baekduia sp.]HET6505216.1 hypothetical protein [Baekduia sp.]
MHDTVEPPFAVSVRFPCAVNVVLAGSQFAADADPAPTNAIAAEAATTTDPSFFMLRMLLSFVPVICTDIGE